MAAVAGDDAGNYPSSFCHQAAAAVGQGVADDRTTLSMTVEHYSSASAALNADVTQHVTGRPTAVEHYSSASAGLNADGFTQHVTDTDRVLTVTRADPRGCCQYAGGERLDSGTAPCLSLIHI